MRHLIDIQTNRTKQAKLCGAFAALAFTFDCCRFVFPEYFGLFYGLKASMDMGKEYFLLLTRI